MKPVKSGFNEHKRWIIQSFNKELRKWQKCSILFLTKAAASYNITLLEQNDKYLGSLVNYRAVCIAV